MRMSLAQFFRELGRIMTGKHPDYPTQEVRFNITVAEEALELAGRLKGEPPEFVLAALTEAARLLQVQEKLAANLTRFDGR